MVIADLTLIEKVLKEQTGYRISKETGIYQSTINRWTSGITPLENMSIKHGILLTELALKLEKEVKNMENLKVKVKEILEACTGGYYVVNIEADDFEDQVVCELDNEALYTALGFDWEILSEVIEAEKEISRLYDGYNTDEYKEALKKYDEVIEKAGDAKEKYETYDDIDWVEWEDTPAFEEMVNSFVDDLKKIIEENELTNYTLS